MDSRFPGDEDLIFTLVGREPVSDAAISQCFKRGFRAVGVDTVLAAAHLCHVFAGVTVGGGISAFGWPLGGDIAGSLRAPGCRGGAVPVQGCQGQAEELTRLLLFLADVGEYRSQTG